MSQNQVNKCPLTNVLEFAKFSLPVPTMNEVNDYEEEFFAPFQFALLALARAPIRSTSLMLSIHLCLLRPRIFFACPSVCGSICWSNRWSEAKKLGPHKHSI